MYVCMYICDTNSSTTFLKKKEIICPRSHQKLDLAFNMPKLSHKTVIKQHEIKRHSYEKESIRNSKSRIPYSSENELIIATSNSRATSQNVE